MPLAAITFLTPFGAVVAIAVVLPLVAYRSSRLRQKRGRALLGLDEPPRQERLELWSLALVPLLLGLAAAGPAIRRHVGHRIRTHAEAIFILDTSRSMAAAASFHAPTRFAQAQSIAMELRNDALADVPSGVSSLNTELLPHLFPTSDAGAFDSTIENAVGIEKPPPPFLQYGVKGTSFEPLLELRSQGFFNPKSTLRLAIVLSDGESGPIDAPLIGEYLTLAGGYPPTTQFQVGGFHRTPESPVDLVVIRVGTGADRVYDADGNVESQYRPDPQAAQIVKSLAAATHGYAFTSADISSAEATLRKLVGSSSSSLQGKDTNVTTVAPYLVLAAIVPLGFLVRRRNLTSI